MNFEFLAGFAVSFAMFATFLFYLVKHRNDKELAPGVMQIFLIGIIHLIIAVFSFLWFFGIFSYSESDFLIIYSLLLLIQGFFLFMITYNISKQNNKLFYLLFFYIIVFLAIIFLDVSFMKIFISVYFLLVILFSVNFLIMGEEYKTIGLFGLFYSSISILLNIFVIANSADVYLFSIFYSAMVFAFLFVILKHMKKHPVHYRKKREDKKKNYAFTLLRDFVFLLAMINLIFIATIVIHELGHLVISYLYNCASREIVLNFSGGFADTQILCSNVTTKLFVAAGGPILPLLLSLALIAIGGKFMKEIGLLLAGFNFVISYPDFIDMGLSGNFSVFFIIIGIILVVAGVVLLAKSRAEDYIYSIKEFE